MGKHKTKKGYVRLNRKINHHSSQAYEHRWVADQAIKEWNPFGWTELPKEVTIHHIDFKEAHNCRQNLCLMDKVLHDATSKNAKLRDPYTGQFLSKGQWERRYGDTSCTNN